MSKKNIYCSSGVLNRYHYVLGSDVQIVVKPKPPRHKTAAFEVVFA
jgi:hypothetical protein